MRVLLLYAARHIRKGIAEYDTGHIRVTEFVVKLGSDQLLKRGSLISEEYQILILEEVFCLTAKRVRNELDGGSTL